MDVYSSSVWRTTHGDVNATGKYMSYAELAAKFGMPARKATQIVNKLGSLGFLRVKRWMRDRADNERNEYMTRTLGAVELAELAHAPDRGSCTPCTRLCAHDYLS